MLHHNGDETGICKNKLNDYLYRSVLLCLNGLQHVHNSHPFQHLSKNDMFPIQMWCGHSCDEELGAIRVGPSISHAEQAHLVMLQGQGNELFQQTKTFDKKREIKVELDR